MDELTGADEGALRALVQKHAAAARMPAAIKKGSTAAFSRSASASAKASAKAAAKAAAKASAAVEGGRAHARVLEMLGGKPVAKAAEADLDDIDDEYVDDDKDEDDKDEDDQPSCFGGTCGKPPSTPLAAVDKASANVARHLRRSECLSLGLPANFLAGSLHASARRPHVLRIDADFVT